ncbi:MAG: rRNA maturation RNase YbeY [Coriobacteriia bacterium]|nr:rRNA maturation RNase YbeY [Coriobacteriia bacterium]
MNVWIVSHRDPEPLNLDAFVDLARFALEREVAPDNSEVSIAVVDNDEMAQLNERYRDKKGPTDVLSFPCDEPTMVPTDDEPLTLGDIVIAPLVAEKNASDLGHTVEHELNHLLVHGILHLMGYDHVDDEDARHMLTRQTVIVQAWTIHV